MKLSAFFQIFLQSCFRIQMVYLIGANACECVRLDVVGAQEVQRGCYQETSALISPINL